MKKTSIFILTLAAALLCSCAKDTPADKTLKARTGNDFCVECEDAVEGVIALPGDGGSFDVDIEGNVIWDVSGDESLGFSAVKGAGDDVLGVIVGKNPSFDARTLDFTVSTEEEVDNPDPEIWTEFGRTFSFTVSQEGKGKLFSVEKTAYEAACTDTGLDVVLTQNVGFTVSCSEGLTWTSAPGDDEDITVVSFAFPANEDLQSKEYSARISPEKFSEELTPIDITITQAGFIPVFSVDPVKIEVNWKTTSASFVLTENVGYSISCDSGVTYTVEEVAAGHKVNLSFAANNEGEGRQYDITVTPGKAGVQPLAVVLRQAPYKEVVITSDAKTNVWYYNNGTADVVIPTRTASTSSPFWHKDYPDFKFVPQTVDGKTGSACWKDAIWFNNESNAYILLPNVADYRLVSVNLKCANSGGKNNSLYVKNGNSFSAITDNIKLQGDNLHVIPDSVESGTDIYLFTASSFKCTATAFTYIYEGIEW